ncbi:MAG TPA: tetratricopeptide repeat protein, partial [Kofleriaceae bacterium]|nr:tetratricopeptide repeat protein [Kofleriaceae bacterium]
MSPSDFVSRGQALVEAGQYQEAVKVCRLGLLGRPTAVDGRVVLGLALLALKRYDEVLAEMRVALEMESGNASAHMLKGEALLRKGDAYAASDALMRARSLAPGDPQIAKLASEADAAISAGGGRRGGMGFGDFGDSMTKHYPTHRGTAPGEPGSKGFTKPTLAGVRAPQPAPSLDIGDKSGTVEIDPELEGVEVGRAYDLDDDVADPPPPRAATEDVADADVVEVEARELRLRGKSFAPPPNDYHDEQATIAERPQAGAARGRGLGPLDETPQPEPLRPSSKSPAPRASSPARSAKSPTPKAAKDLDPALARSAAAIDDLFPDEEPAPARGPGPAKPKPVARDSDMDMIRAGLSSGIRAATPSAAAPPPAGRPESTGVLVERGAPPRKSGTEIVKTPKPQLAPPKAAPRSRIQTIAWSAIAAIVLGGGVLAGFTIRSIRLEGQLSTARTEAGTSSHADTWNGWQDARDWYAGIVDVHDDAASRAAVLRARAVLAADFGDDVAGARFALQGGDASGETDTQIATAYMALLDGDAAAAQAAATSARSAAGAAVGDYLLGRAALTAQRWTDAAQSLAESIKADARPSAYVALAEAEAGRGRYAEATAACDKALALVPDHPRALIERARIAAASGAPPAVLAEAIAGLDKVATEASSQAPKRGVGPLEVALAALARAEVEHARGDDAAARRALERATASAGDDLRVSDGVIALHLALGDEARAVELAQRAAKTWPKSPGPRVALAAAALAGGDAAKALEALGKAGDLTDRPFALALRGRAHLAAGEL